MEILSSLLISPLISLLVCYITIYSSNRRNKKSLDIQQANHKEILEISEMKYQKQLVINEENERLKHLPYLSLTPKKRKSQLIGNMLKIDEPNIYSIPFEITNNGAGTAFSISLDYLDTDSKYKEIQPSIVVSQQVFNCHYDILGVREPIDMDILPIQTHTEFCLYQSAVDRNLKMVDPTSNLKWEFIINYSDIQGRKYSQKYSFYSSTSEAIITRITSEMPRILPESNNNQ